MEDWHTRTNLDYLKRKNLHVILPSYFENESAVNKKAELLNKINRNLAVVL